MVCGRVDERALPSTSMNELNVPSDRLQPSPTQSDPSRDGRTHCPRSEPTGYRLSHRNAANLYSVSETQRGCSTLAGCASQNKTATVPRTEDRTEEAPGKRAAPKRWIGLGRTCISRQPAAYWSGQRGTIVVDAASCRSVTYRRSIDRRPPEDSGRRSPLKGIFCRRRRQRPVKASSSGGVGAL